MAAHLVTGDLRQLGRLGLSTRAGRRMLLRFLTHVPPLRFRTAGIVSRRSVAGGYGGAAGAEGLWAATDDPYYDRAVKPSTKSMISCFEWTSSLR